MTVCGVRNYVYDARELYRLDFVRLAPRVVVTVWSMEDSGMRGDRACKHEAERAWILVTREALVSATREKRSSVSR